MAVHYWFHRHLALGREIMALLLAILLFSASIVVDADYADVALDKSGCQPGVNKQTCANCTHLRLCFGSWTPGADMACSSLSIDEPYCVNGACSAEPDVSEPTCRKETKFMCTHSGYMPDPDNCGQFYHCGQPGANPGMYQCPDGYHFDVDNARCMPSLDPRDCDIRRMVCMGGTQFALYRPNPAYYRLCQNKSVFRCDDTANERFDVTAANCVPHCTEKKTFKNKESPSQYYSCVRRMYGDFEAQPKTCMFGMVYDATVGACKIPAQ